MKNRPWLEISENVLLFGSGVGSVASVVSQQLIYAAAPLSCFLLLNLVNRRRFEQLTQQTTAVSLSQIDQRLSSNINAIRQQVLSLPNLLDLNSLRKTILQKHEEAIANLNREMERQFDAFKEQGLDQSRRNVTQLQSQYASLTEAVNGITSYLNRLTPLSRVEGLESSLTQLKAEMAQLQTNLQNLTHEPKPNLTPLQDQINHLNRRLNNLPPPFDASSLKQDLESLIKLVGDLVPRREMSKLVLAIEHLQKQQQTIEQSVAPVRLAITIVKRQLDELATKSKFIEPTSGNTAQLPQPFAELQNKLSTLEQRLELIPQGSQSSESTKESSILQLLDTSAFQIQLEVLASRLDGVETYLTDLQTQVKEVAQSKFNPINHSLEAMQATPKYDLVFALRNSQPQQEEKPKSVPGSQSILEEVLQHTQEHLIIVWPWFSKTNFDQRLIQAFRSLLDRNGKIEMGLGHLGDSQKSRLPLSIDHQTAIVPPEKSFLLNALNQLTQLKREYPKQFKFKILGTDENFLVCDRSLAILGVHNISTASNVFPDLEVGLRTTDSRVIQGLINRYKDPIIDAHDAVAYFQRAATRYELGDKPGAITDYTQVLEIHPQDDIALNNRGLALFELGRKREALADFEQALLLNPSNVVAYCNRGFVSTELGDKIGAIKDYSKAIQINPEYAKAYFYRGLARTRLGDKLGAVEDYSEVLRMEPHSGLTYFYRGLARTKLGDKEGAIEDLLHAAQFFVAQGNQTSYQKALDMALLIFERVDSTALSPQALNHPLLQQHLQNHNHQQSSRSLSHR